MAALVTRFTFLACFFFFPYALRNALINVNLLHAVTVRMVQAVQSVWMVSMVPSVWAHV